MKYRATLTTTEVFEIYADTKEIAHFRVFEDLSDEQRGTADLELEEIDEVEDE